VGVATRGRIVDHSAEIEGYLVNFITFRANLDATPLMRGLPDDSCTCPHWGQVLSGRMTYRVGDREETFVAGDAFYLPPGHIPIGNEPGSEILQLSPASELRAVQEVMRKNAEAMQSS